MKKLFLILFLVGCTVTAATPALQSPLQQCFDAGGKYYPAQGEHYQLVGCAALTGNVNNRIRAIVLDQTSQPAFGIVVRHAFGTDHEDFAYVGDPVQFNLGGGSHYPDGADPPDHIFIRDFPSDEMRLGNCSCIGYSHIDALLTFRWVGNISPTPVLPTPIFPTPGSTPTINPTECGTLTADQCSSVKNLINRALQQGQFR